MQVSETFMLFLTAVKYLGLNKLRANSLRNKSLGTHVCMTVLWMSWAAVVLLSNGIRDTDHNMTTSQCFFGSQIDQYGKLIILVCSCVDLCIALCILALNHLILQKIADIQEVQTGRSHGKRHALGNVRKRLLIISTVSGLVIVAPSSAMITMSTTGCDFRQASYLVMSVFSLQSLANPFIYTLRTQRFISILKKILRRVYLQRVRFSKVPSS